MYPALQKAIEIVGGQTALAKALNKKQGHVWIWLERGWVPPDMAIPIERATSGQVTRSDLLPDIYPPEKSGERAVA
jgi:DNA-binding transcriptional regulator YdaS (Cro superfamily)